MNINYFAEINLPSKNAYSIHVMKMCEALSDNNKVILYTFKKNNNVNLYKIYNCKKKFTIKDFNLDRFSFLNRIKFCIKLFKIFKNKKKNFKSNLIISRSILGGLFMAFFNYKVIIEIHHELAGFTNLIFKITKLMYFFKKIKFIFITKNLVKKFKLSNSYIILDDAVNIEDFNIKKKQVNNKKTCVYTGSLAPGKGLEKIIEISKILKKINFDIYGDFLNSDFKECDLKKYSNINFKGHVEYRHIPNILNKYNVVLMPYSEKVYVRAKNIETSKYMSPMKLFDYMASKKIIVASKLDVYTHILNNKNSIMIKKHSPKIWAKKIDYVFKNISKLNYLKKNAFETVKKYTWIKRIEKIEKFIDV